MICNACRRTLASRARLTQLRTVATAPATTNAAPNSLPPQSAGNQQTPATSSATPALSQPLSAGMGPTIPTAKSQDKYATLQSSTPGGTELKGLGYLKAKPSILAKEDSEYPEWLWTLLDTDKQGDGKSAVDLAAMTKKQRIKYDRKQARLMKDVAKPIPIHEQSSDLTQPGESADISLQRRQELTKSSRDARRKSIRESNFLRGM